MTYLGQGNVGRSVLLYPETLRGMANICQPFGAFSLCQENIMPQGAIASSAWVLE